MKENRPDDTHFLKLLSDEIELMEDNIRIKKVVWKSKYDLAQEAKAKEEAAAKAKEEKKE